jgi:hypothetical protein
MALTVLAVSRLLADKHEPRTRAPFAKNRLRGVLVEIAGLASGGGRAQTAQR